MSRDFLPPNIPLPISPDSSFVRPPLDGSLAIPEIYDWHLIYNPNFPVFKYAEPDGSISTLAYREFVRAAHGAGRLFATSCSLDVNSDSHTFPVVAIIAVTDTITFFTTIVGLLRLGAKVFPISPRFTPDVVSHLLVESGVSYILRSKDTATVDLTNRAIQHAREKAPAIRPITMSSFEELYRRDFELLPSRKYDLSQTTLIVHSSGSDSLPKLILWNTRRDLQTAICPWFGSHDFRCKVFGCHAIELYHGLGLCWISYLPSSGMIMATFKPSCPPVLANADNVYDGIVKLGVSYVLVNNPGLIKSWAADEEKVNQLRNLKALSYAGLHLTKVVGDKLSSEGVQLYTVYGSCEAGNICQIFPEPLGQDWEYFKINPYCGARFQLEQNGFYHLFVEETPTQELYVVNAEYNGRPAYATSDRFVKHPTRSDLWKILGRNDDQIVLKNGIMINPRPLEEIVMEHPNLRGAIIFGSSQYCLGVIVDVNEKCTGTSVVDKLDSLIWSKIEEMNAFIDPRCRIKEEMVLRSKIDKPFVYNSKKLPRRPYLLELYKDEIENAYSSI